MSMTLQQLGIYLSKWLDGYFIYIVMQLGRGILFSFFTLVLVLLLRNTICKKAVFLRGLLWCLFLPVPFVGKLRIFYETRFFVRRFLWWHNLCVEESWICWLYILGILIFGGYLLYKRLQIKRFLLEMEQVQIEGRKVYVWDKAVTPFTTGLFSPKIVIPRIMLKTYESEEIQTILLHERTHIRLGHLWYYLMWDILRVLLWPNFLLTLAGRYLKEDLENVCDRIVIQKSKKPAYDYGKLLLKSLRILGEEPIQIPVAFAGEQEYQGIKSRMEQVAQFKPYKKHKAVLCFSGGILLAVTLLLGTRLASYPPYEQQTDIIICSPDLQLWWIGDEAELADAIAIDEENVYINPEAWNQVLEANNIEEEFYFVYFGGYMKMPSIGGGGNGIYLDHELAEEEVIPYYNNDTDIWNLIFKWM